jgi:hypothetical protein
MRNVAAGDALRAPVGSASLARPERPAGQQRDAGDDVDRDAERRGRIPW